MSRLAANKSLLDFFSSGRNVLIFDRICIKTRPFNEKTIFFNYFFSPRNFRNPLQSTDCETQMPGGMRSLVFNNMVSWTVLPISVGLGKDLHF